MAGRCPKCKEIPEKFSLHDFYSRNIKEYHGVEVVTYRIKLSLWKCFNCNRCSALYPDFILPFARYARDSIEKLTEKYLYSTEETYRSTVMVEKEPILHVFDGHFTDTALKHGTLWNWMSILSRERDEVNSYVQELKEYSPQLPIFRQHVEISVNKYRSIERRNCLENVLFYLQIRPLWKKYRESCNFQ